MKLFNKPKKFMIKPNPEYVDIDIEGQPPVNKSTDALTPLKILDGHIKLDKQLLECVKYNAKMDITDHAPVFDIVGLATSRSRGFPTDLVTIDYGDLLVTYEIAERNGEYKPIQLRWQHKDDV